MFTALNVLLLIILIATIKLGLRHTTFSTSPTNGKLGGTLLNLEIFLAIIIGCAVFEFVETNRLNVFHVTPDSITYTTPIIITCLIILIGSIALFSSTIFKSELITLNYTKDTNSLNKLTDTTTAIAFIVASFIVLKLSFGATHAFLAAATSNQDLLSTRLANKYNSNVPAIILTYSIYTEKIFAILIGLTWNHTSRARKTIHILLLAASSTMQGDKSPIVFSALLILISKNSLNHQNIASIAIKIVLYGAIISTTTLFAIWIQNPSIDTEGLAIFVLGRIGAGQIQGVYEQFALGTRDLAYILPELPFSGQSNTIKIYSKDLMMNTFGLDLIDPTQTGVMNSFFIGEANAIGGLPLTFIAPIAFAFNYCLSAYITSKLFRKVLGTSKTISQVIATLIASSITPLTGDLGGMLFGKRVIFITAIIVLIILISQAYTKTKSIVMTRRTPR